MIFELSHKERPGDRQTLNPYADKTHYDHKIVAAAKDFLCNKFGFKYHGVLFIDGRTISFIESRNEAAVRRCIKIGTPIFAKLTGSEYEDIQVKVINNDDCEKRLSEIRDILEEA